MFSAMLVLAGVLVAGVDAVVRRMYALASDANNDDWFGNG
jgi:hypothetical protein